MRHHAIQALVGRAGGSDDHLALALGQAAFFLEHECVVVGEKRPPLGRAARKRQKHVGDEARLLLHLKDAGADVLGQGVQIGKRVARGHGGCLLTNVRAPA